jgi:hypothetical protein
LLVHDDVFPVYQFDKEAKIDLKFFDHTGFCSATFTDEEVSIVTKEDLGMDSGKIHPAAH